MLSDLREVVKEGRILHFVSGSRMFEISNSIILEIIESITYEPTLENQPLTRKISKWFFISRHVYARFWTILVLISINSSILILLKTSLLIFPRKVRIDIVIPLSILFSLVKSFQKKALKSVSVLY